MKLYEVNVLGKQLVADIRQMVKLCGNITLTGNLVLSRTFDEKNEPVWSLESAP